jgi:exopolysaccharide biosynthesis polyprenyl glycosylphosphotransferase
MSQLSAYQVGRSTPLIGNARWAERLLIRVGLVIVDLLAISLGFRLAYFLRFEAVTAIYFDPTEHAMAYYSNLVFWLIPIWLILFSQFRLYDFEILFGGTWEYAKVFNACSSGMMLVILGSFLYPDFIIARAWLLLSWILITFNVLLGRLLFRRLIYFFRRRGRFLTTILIVGANEEGVAVAEQLSHSPSSGIWLAGFVDDHLKEGKMAGSDLRVLGVVKELPELVVQHGIQEIIISSSALTRQQLLDIFRMFGNSDNVTLRLSTGLFEIFTTGLQVREVGSVPLLRLNKVRLTGLEVLFKAAIDYAAASLGLLATLPLFVLIGIAVKYDSAGPIFHRRKVLGVGGKSFYAFKFRSMHVNADEILEEILANDEALRKEFEADHKLKNDPRVTRIGNFLRRTSLDELPQLINVLRGEMSLIGPRMITEEEQQRYGKWDMNLLTVKPGITGLWQVSGRNDISYDERVRLDMHYIRNYSVWMDLHILYQTVPKVLRGSGAY